MQLISVIIPTLDEERALPATLVYLARQRGEFELIVVDGGSNDATIAVARRFPNVTIVNAPPGRAAQMNSGAAIASGEWLVFLHADTLLPAGAFDAIRAAGEDPDCLAGGFRQRFNDPDWRLAWLSRLGSLRCSLTSIVYGDQALFVRRSVFEELGGFPQAGVMEDVALCKRIRQRAKPVLLDLAVTTDARKFNEMGVWTGIWRLASIHLRQLLHRPIGPSHPFFRDVR